MADSRVPTNADSRSLRSLLARVGRRYRAVDAAWGATSWAWAGAALALAILIVARAKPVENDVVIAATAGVCWLLAIIAWPLLRSRSAMFVALRADLDLKLKDRLSTAVSFEDSVDDTSGLHLLQRSDAVDVAAMIQPRRDLPVMANRPRAVVAAVIAALAVALAALPNPQHEVLAQRESVEAAAVKEAVQIEELRHDLLSDSALTDEEKAQLDEALAKLRDRLRESDGKADDALADIAAAEADIQRLRDSAAVRKGNAAAGLEQQLDRLARSEGSGESPGDGSTTDDLDELLDQLGNLTEAEIEALAKQLEEMALTASAALPDTAAALAELAEAIRAGDQSAASTAAQAAAEAMSQASASAAGAESVEGALGQCQASRQAIASAGAAGTGALAASPSGMTGAQGGAMAEGSAQGGAQSESGSQSEGQGSGQGEGSGSGQGEGSGSGQGEGSGSGQGEGSGSGRGEGSGSGAADTTGQNSGDGGGEGAGGGFGRTGEGAPGAHGETTSSGTGRQWEPVADPQEWREGWSTLIYAPADEVLAGDSEFVPGRLSSETGSREMRERETRSEGSTGPALVPYEQVYGRYNRVAGEALQREMIPVRLRDYVKQYFAQLEPQ